VPEISPRLRIDLILERYQQTKEKHLLAMAETTLEKMARGGVYDQLAGGSIATPSTNAGSSPLREMSYDNSDS